MKADNETIYTEDQGRLFGLKLPGYRYNSTPSSVIRFIEEHAPSKAMLIKEGNKALYKKALFCCEIKRFDHFYFFQNNTTFFLTKRAFEIFILSTISGIIMDFGVSHHLFQSYMFPIIMGSGMFFILLRFVCSINNNLTYNVYLNDLNLNTAVTNVDTLQNPNV